LIGLSSFLNQVGFSILAAAVNILLKNYGTAVDMSVYGVISRIHIFITMPLLGLAQGFHSIVGFNFGAGNYKRVSETVKISFIYAFAIGLFLFGFLVFMPQDILRLFTDKPEVIQNGVFALRITTLMTPVIGLQIIAYFYFMAVHKAVTAMLVSLSRQVIFILPPLIVLPLFMGKQGIWLAFPMADVVAVAVSAALLLRSVNKQVKEGSLPDRCS
jgi:Na+-driven multidrug efflux pump